MSCNFSIKQRTEKVKDVYRYTVAGQEYNLYYTRSEVVTVEALPELEPTGERLVDVSSTGKDRKWDERKQQNLQLAALFKKAREISPTVISTMRLLDMEQCGNILAFALNEKEEKRLFKANFCRNRFCNICAWRRSLKLYAQISATTDRILEDEPKTQFIFLTLTQKNISRENLEAELDRMVKGFKNLVQKKKNNSAGAVFRSNLLGYIKAVEITYNIEAGTFHPHMHVIMAICPDFFQTRNYITQKRWREIWRDCMGLDYLPLINVKKISSKAKAVAELTKYPAKPVELVGMDSPEGLQDLVALVESTRKRRFVSLGGIFKKTAQELRLQDVESKDANLLDIGDSTGFNAVAVAVYKYHMQFGCYINSGE